jgi:protein RecA
MPIGRKKATAKKRTAGGSKASASRSSSGGNAAVHRLVAANVKTFGSDAFSTYDTGDGCEITKWYSTTVPVLDAVLSGTVGHGFPGGRVVEMFGENHCGKTTLMLQALADAQRSGGYAQLSDTESTITRKRLVALGVDTKSLMYSHVQYIEDVLNVMIATVKKSKNLNGLMAVDSVAGASTRAEAGREVGEGAFGVHARSMSQGLRKFAPLLARTNVAAVFINQRKQGGIGNPYASARDRDSTLGGDALKFHAHIRLRLMFARKVQMPLVPGGKPQYVGDLVKATVVKNKERGSETKACECLLFIRKLGENRGQIDNALSAWHTLLHWGVFKKSRDKATGKEKAGKLMIGNTAYTLDRWQKDYNINGDFRDMVAEGIERAVESLATDGEVHGDIFAVRKKTTQLLEEE